MVPYVRQHIPETYEQREPSDQTEKPDYDLGNPAGDCCSTPPGVAAAPLNQDALALTSSKALRKACKFSLERGFSENISVSASVYFFDMPLEDL